MTQRLDAALAARGLARSRTHAANLIEEGRVQVAGRVAGKASIKVDDATDIAVTESDHYVSRGAHKLIGALDGFGIEVAGSVALDMGASTGGFTQVLRERGADPVIAVDVGHGQLAPSVAIDGGVRSVEGYNVRYMTAESLAAASGVDAAPSVITGDLSFISLTQVLPAVAQVASRDADVILLVKPQFEVGRSKIGGGVVTDVGLRADAVLEVLFTARDLGLGTLGVLPSPIHGTHGNVETLIHIAPGRGTDPTEWKTTIERCCAG
ncbi:TlyA family RNA methyltransferase [Microbacterium paludicola]|uniref:TlyA family RNA methyltransferase n=1 Tax=Microbacterium paludicola TaxID=300019 RepID=A0A4Y9FQW3_9MICO|nr:TlyA family RNA methyltransferase [Microbacterium paludicola]MBF0817357.1 TlyA family RNA methyltransferase [Microbacterium paludicola]TFU31591.1 TlyA family RNA methyltransferase [Microbacterium paludicola]